MRPEQEFSAYERLRIEIVRVAVEDYKAALRTSAIIGTKSAKEEELEQFFLSAWGQALCGGCGEYIMERCRKEGNKRTTKDKRFRKIQPKHQAGIVKDCMSGMTLEEMARKYGVSVTTISRYVEEWV